MNRTCWWILFVKLYITSHDYTELHLYRPLNELVEFRSDETNAAYRSVLPLPVRKMIAREVNLEQMRRNESMASTRRHGSSNAISKMTHEPSEATIEEKAAKITYALPELSGRLSRLRDHCVNLYF